MTAAVTDGLLACLVLSGLGLLGATRLRTVIGVSAGQGLLAAALALCLHADWREPRPWLLALGVAGLKGIVFPWLLFRALREGDLRHDERPYVGVTLSVLAGMAALGLALRFGAGLPSPEPLPSVLVVPLALFLIQVGLFLIVTRRSAVSHVIGYLTLENGIYVFGVAMVHGQPLLVEFGILLDVFVAVFVMGIAIFSMGRELDSVDTDQLAELKD